MNPSDSPINKLVNQAAADGKYDSAGVFTIAQMAAVAKLAAFQLPRESAWILKVIQAAVSGGADAVDVRQGKDSTRFRYSQSQALDLGLLRTALGSAQTGVESPVEHLAVGLRAAGIGQNRHFQLTVHQGKRRDRLTWDGQALRHDVETTTKAAANCAVDLSVDFTAGEKGRSMSNPGPAIRCARDEALELTRKASVCPIPLTLDGRRLDNLSSPEKRDERLLRSPSIGWTQAGTSKVRLRLPKGVNLGRYHFVLGNTNVLWPEFLFQMFFHLEPRSMLRVGQSWCHWVLDGVVCLSEEIAIKSSPISLDVFICANDLQTDVSGLVLKPDEELVRRRREGLKAAVSFVERLMNNQGQNKTAHRDPFGLSDHPPSVLVSAAVGFLRIFTPPPSDTEMTSAARTQLTEYWSSLRRIAAK